LRDAHFGRLLHDSPPQETIDRSGYQVGAACPELSGTNDDTPRRRRRTRDSWWRAEDEGERLQLVLAGAQGEIGERRELLSPCGFPPDLVQNVRHLVDDFAALQRLARFVIRIGLEQRPYPTGHFHQLMVALVSERGAVVVEPREQFLENRVQILVRMIPGVVQEFWSL
jgi:hypothetical protein